MRFSIHRRRFELALALLLVGSLGCTAGIPPSPKRLKHPSITAMPASPQNMGEPCGIPFYLPKPLLVVSKNFHHIEEPKVGLTAPPPVPPYFDDQSDYARLNAQSEVRHNTGGSSGSTGRDGGSLPSNLTYQQGQPFVHPDLSAPVSPGFRQPRDGLAPHTFFTYEIVFIPDLTQKYVLQVEGGAGELRAVMNLVNGWQFTGLGPYYMKDSSTAQNLLAKGVAVNLGLTGAADVINSAANLVERAAPGGLINARDLAAYAREVNEASMEETVDFAAIQEGVIERYAEIYVYEPTLGLDGQMQWRQIVGEFDETLQQFLGHRFNRTYLGAVRRARDPAAVEGLGRALEPLSRALAPAAPAPRDTDGAARADRARDNLSLLPPVDQRPALYQDVIGQTLVDPENALPERKGLLGLFHKRGTVQNRSVSLEQ